MLRIVIALVLFAHGVGHSMGPIQIFNVAAVNPEFHGDSWLLSGLGATTTQLVGVALWTIALVGFVALAAVVMGWLPIEWWTPLAVVSSIVSIAGIVLFPTAFPVLSNVGAIVIDVAVLAAVAWFNWSPAQLPA